MWPLRKMSKLIEDREVIRKLSQLTSPFSPDMGLLSEHQRLLVFVHDDMMAGKNNADLIAETSITGRYALCNAYTEDKFYFWRKDLGSLSYPVALDLPVTGFHPSYFDVAPAKIWGELYAVRPIAFNKLDTERENGVQYTRRQVDICIPYIYSNPVPEFRKVILKAWMYVGNHEYWDDQLGGIHSSKPIDKTPDPRSWLGEHYRFK